MEKVSEDLKLGARYRGQSDFDRYYFRYSYANGMLTSSGDFWYNSANAAGGAKDAFEVEAWPLGLKYGDFGVAWYVRGTVNQGSLNNGETENDFEHQARFYWDFYKGEKLALNAEYRITLADDIKVKGGDSAAIDDQSENKAFGRHQFQLAATYAVTESLDISGYYLYDIMNEKEYVVDGKADDNGRYYGEFAIGWNYKF